MILNMIAESGYETIGDMDTHNIKYGVQITNL